MSNIDLEKEREAFEIYELSKYPKANKEILFARFKESDLGEDEKDFEGRYINNQIDERFTSWIELAKAKQVEIDELKAKLRSCEIDSNQLLTERDEMQEFAEQLKDRLQEVFNQDFGDHSNANCPFTNALEYDDSGFVLVSKDVINVLKELTQFSSYAEIVGGISVNRSAIREQCDIAFNLIRELEDAEFTEMIKAAQGNSDEQL